MITMEQINGEIDILENEKPTHTTMQKLAALYIVRDHMILAAQPHGAVVVDALPDFGESEFAHAVSGRSPREIMSAMDELVSTLQVVNPRLYNCLMHKICE